MEKDILNTVSDNIDFWKDAQEFLKDQLSIDFENKLKDYITNKGYNQNEIRLFNKIIKTKLDFLIKW